jgi:transcriptional regulator GlxA family with amidase domain
MAEGARRMILASVLGSADPNAAATASPHRVNRAKEMMDDQRLSLTEITLDCGFSSSS